MKILIKKVLNRMHEYFFYYKNKYSHINICVPVQIDWRKIFLDIDTKLTIKEFCIVRGNLHCQKEGAVLRIGRYTFIGSNTDIVSTKKVTIGDNVLISHNCYITDTDGHSLDKIKRRDDIPNRWKNFKDWSVVCAEEVVIHSDVWIGPNSIILKGVTIGEGTIISAGSVVTKSFPRNVVVAGVPGKVIKKLNVDM